VPSPLFVVTSLSPMAFSPAARAINENTSLSGLGGASRVPWSHCYAAFIRVSGHAASKPANSSINFSYAEYLSFQNQQSLPSPQSPRQVEKSVNAPSNPPDNHHYSQKPPRLSLSTTPPSAICCFTGSL
jgi:hypothetical protein